MVTAVEAPAFLRRDDLDRLIALLREDGRTVIGPTVSDGAIVYDEIRSARDLPSGWSDEQGPGTYRLVETNNERTFDFPVGPTSWKRYTFPSRVPIGRAQRGPTDSPSSRSIPSRRRSPSSACAAASWRRCGSRTGCSRKGPSPTRTTWPGARPPSSSRSSAAWPSATCFCTSMGTGPEVRRDDADLVLTELDDGFVVRAGSEIGRSLAERLPLEVAGVERTEQGPGGRGARAPGDRRSGRGRGPPRRLLAQLDDPRWAEVADRCLACANCTLVCPTCFCTSVSQRSDLDGLRCRSSGPGTRASRATSPRSPAATSGPGARTATASG